MPAFRPVSFDPYRRRRSRRLVPGWLLLLLLGAAAGAVALLLVQESYLPPRLSAAESASLRESLGRADTERKRLADELAANAKRLDAALADNKRIAGELGAARDSVAPLRAEVDALLAAMPPDPRAGAVAVRAARLRVVDGALAYDIVLSREGGAAKPLQGAMQLVVAGETARGNANTISLQPVAVSIGQYESVRGSQPLPAGFKPRRTTVQVLDANNGKRLGMRVLRVQ